MAEYGSKTRVERLAADALEWFERVQRGDETIDALRAGRPDWVLDLVYEAHGEFGPDDWRYSVIRSALETISEDEGSDVGEFADGAVDTYTGRRLAWLASNLSRPNYCDEAVSEGLLSESADLVERVGAGQYVEASEVFGLILSALVERG